MIYISLSPKHDYTLELLGFLFVNTELSSPPAV